MPMSSGGRAASSSECVTSPKAREIGLTGCIVPIQYSLLIGRYVMAMAEHREPCDSRGSCTVLGAPEGEIPPGDSTTAFFKPCLRHVRYHPNSGAIGHFALACNVAAIGRGIPGGAFERLRVGDH